MAAEERFLFGYLQSSTISDLKKDVYTVLWAYITVGLEQRLFSFGQKTSLLTSCRHTNLMHCLFGCHSNMLCCTVGENKNMGSRANRSYDDLMGGNH